MTGWEQEQDVGHMRNFIKCHNNIKSASKTNQFFKNSTPGLDIESYFQASY
jgi:hypothetical protein